MKIVISNKVKHRIGIDEIVKTLNTKFDTNFTVADFNKWKAGKYSPEMNTAIKAYVCTKGCRIAAALGAMAAKLKLVESGVV